MSNYVVVKEKSVFSYISNSVFCQCNKTAQKVVIGKDVIWS